MAIAYQWNTNIDQQYPLVSGREIFELPSITGLNRLPIITLAGYITSGASAAPDVNLDHICEALLVDGSLFWIDAELQTRVVYADAGTFRCTFPSELIGGDEITREYIQSIDGDWRMTDYQRFGDYGQTVINTATIAGDRVRYWHNPRTPEGLLRPAQYTYRRLEEIMQTIRIWQSGPGAKTIVYGLAMSAALTEQKLMSTSPAAFLPGDLNVDRLANTAAIDQLITEMERLQPLYYQQVHIVDTTSPVQRPSGADRSLVLGPMMRFVDTARGWITNVLAMFDQTWEFDRLHTTDVLDRTAELDLLERLESRGALSREAVNTKGAKLI